MRWQHLRVPGTEKAEKLRVRKESAEEREKEARESSRTEGNSVQVVEVSERFPGVRAGRLTPQGIHSVDVREMMRKR